MVGIVNAGHGRFPSGVKSAAEPVAGGTKGAACGDFRVRQREEGLSTVGKMGRLR